jgi:hypothetical protein
MGDILIDNKDIYYFQSMFLKGMGIATKIVVFLFIVGFFQEKPQEYLKLAFFVKILLGFFLIYRFNKFRQNKIQFTELDRKACYSAGVFILVVSFVDILNNYVEKIREVVLPYTLPMVDFVKNFNRNI